MSLSLRRTIALKKLPHSARKASRSHDKEKNESNVSELWRRLKQRPNQRSEVDRDLTKNGMRKRERKVDVKKTRKKWQRDFDYLMQLTHLGVPRRDNLLKVPFSVAWPPIKWLDFFFNMAQPFACGWSTLVSDMTLAHSLAELKALPEALLSFLSCTFFLERIQTSQKFFVHAPYHAMRLVQQNKFSQVDENQKPSHSPCQYKRSPFPHGAVVAFSAVFQVEHLYKRLVVDRLLTRKTMRHEHGNDVRCVDRVYDVWSYRSLLLSCYRSFHPLHPPPPPTPPPIRGSTLLVPLGLERNFQLCP